MQHDSLLFAQSAAIDGVPCRVLFDTGATRSFICAEFAREHGFTLSNTAKFNVVLGIGFTVRASLATKPLPLHVAGLQTSASLIAIPLNAAFDIVLGQDWLAAHHVVLDAAAGTVTIKGGKEAPAATQAAIVDMATPQVTNAARQSTSALLPVCSLDAGCVNGKCLRHTCSLSGLFLTLTYMLMRRS